MLLYHLYFILSNKSLFERVKFTDYSILTIQNWMRNLKISINLFWLYYRLHLPSNIIYRPHFWTCLGKRKILPKVSTCKSAPIKIYGVQSCDFTPQRHAVKVCWSFKKFSTFLKAFCQDKSNEPCPSLLAPFKSYEVSKHVRRAYYRRLWTPITS